jgi:hypothetical protein
VSGFRVRPYEPGDEHGILALFNRVFSEGNPAFEPRTLQAWRALYLDNPAGMQTFVATDADGAIIANYSAIPAAASVRGERRLCCQAVDTCVDRSWRGSLRKGSVFVTIAREFIAHYSTPGRAPFDDFMYGLPNEQAFPVGTRVVGYRPVHVPLHALVYEVGAGTDALIARLDAVAAGGAAAAAGPVTVSEGGAADIDAAAALFEAHRDEVPLGTWRDAAYLRWRYRSRADVQYRTLVARRPGAPAGSAAGALIFRLGWMGQPLVPLVDWFGPGADRGAHAALLAAALRIGRDAGARKFETWLTPNMPHHASLSALGLADEPTRFNLCIMTFAPTVDLEWARAHWCFSMGDSDIF